MELCVFRGVQRRSLLPLARLTHLVPPLLRSQTHTYTVTKESDSHMQLLKSQFHIYSPTEKPNSSLPSALWVRHANRPSLSGWGRPANCVCVCACVCARAPHRELAGRLVFHSEASGMLDVHLCLFEGGIYFTLPILHWGVAPLLLCWPLNQAVNTYHATTVLGSACIHFQHLNTHTLH